MSIINYLYSSKYAFYTSLIVFRFILDLFYILFVNKFYEHSGFGLDVDVNNYLLSWILYIGSFTIARHHIKKVSDYFFVTALLNVVAPLTSMYGLDSKNIMPILVTLSSLFLVYFISKSNFIKLQVPYFKKGDSMAVVLSIILVCFLIIWYCVSGAANNINFKFSEVYNFRANNATLANIGLLAYLNNWILQIFNMFLIAYFLHRQCYLLFAICIVIQIFFYGVSAHKSILFLPLLVFGIWFYFRKFNQLIILPVMFSIVLCGSYSYFYFFNNMMIPSMFIRRVFFVPAQLTFAYFDFFSTNSYVMWSNSILSKMITYSYEFPIGKVIGHYLGTEASANNGYVSSGFAHAGLWGVFIYSVILGFILKLINAMSQKGIPLWLALAITIVPLRSLLISSDLFTVMLTHGLMVSILLLILMRRKHA